MSEKLTSKKQKRREIRRRERAKNEEQATARGREIAAEMNERMFGRRTACC